MESPQEKRLTSRFVVLYHECPPGYQRPSHWDLMLESTCDLRTWALATAPEVDVAMGAEMLKPHRLEYLDYEGPVSDDRGAVTRWDAGTCHVIVDEPNHLVAKIAGTKLVGRIELVPVDLGSQRWRLMWSRS